MLDRAGHHLFQPLLYQCATGILSEGQIAAPLRQLLKRLHNADFELAEVVDIDAGRRQVVARRPGGESFELPYDDLVIAAGMRQCYFGHDEYARWAPGMKTLEDALTIRRRVYGAFEMAKTATDPAERRRWLSFALVGGGPTGVELAGQIRELATKTLHKEFRRLDPDDTRVLLFDGGSVPLASFGPRLSADAAKALEDHGVELHMSSRVTLVDEDGLVVRGASGDETRYEVGTVLWTAGVEAPPLAAAVAAATGARQDRAGRLEVTGSMTLPGHPEIYVVGDLMSLGKLPGVAEVAMQGGLYVGRRIRRQVRGRPPGGGFRYYDLGSAAYISRGYAVVSAGRLRLHGFLGWVSWLFIHIAFLTGYRNRVGAVLTWWVAFTRDRRKERAFTTAVLDQGADVYDAGTPAGTPDPDADQGSEQPGEAAE